MNVKAMMTTSLAILGVATNVFATPITVANASFETTNPLDIPCLGTGCAFNTAAIPGWFNTPGGNTGSWQPGNPANTFYFDTIPDGNTVGYSSGQLIYQDVSEVVQLGVTYTLLVEVGNRKDFPQAGIVQLFIGGINQPGNTIVTATGGTAVEGGWTTFTATYTGIAADVGKFITIGLRANNLGGDFDNMRLSSSTAATVPEPSSLWLIGIAGLVGFGGRLWRREPLRSQCSEKS